MRSVNMLEAKSTLSRLVEAVENGREDVIIIARNGRPVAKLTRADAPNAGKRLGIAKGEFTVPDDIDADNPLIAEMFCGRDD